MPRGYWEAKDTADDLDIEIKKKIYEGYPLTNIIFEDTHRAVLYQDSQRKMEADLTQAQQVTDLLHEFTTHAEPDIELFEQAVAEFKARIPELAHGVLEIISKERGENIRFVTAFGTFHELCKTALDPRISEAQIDEMLVQHLLTERLFRTVFDNQDFTRRNVIASEIENVIDALTSRAFNRAAFLKSLDRFYLAIEDTARGLGDFSEKQHFLNVVYERFFQGFSVKQADTMGIVYTPQEIVDFMCSSVEEVLQREFDKSLSTPGVKILDPCVGTGNFIVNILNRINKRDLKKKYTEDLFCNEIMLLPYYIASLNIEHEYFQLSGEYEQFEGICFTDTLDLAEAKQYGLFSEENTERVIREKDAEITVIFGNPPYNAGQKSENDNNKNRKYPVIDQRIKETYTRDSNATNRNKLGDPYVRFFRWAMDRLQGRDGIVCYISNNSFVDLHAFDGMRKNLFQDFSSIYHLDLHGNIRKNPKLSGTTHNVFGIPIGVGITLAIRNSAHEEHLIHYYRVPEFWTRQEKLGFLRQVGSFKSLSCKRLQPDAQNTWLTDGLLPEFKSYVPIATKSSVRSKIDRQKAAFFDFSLGIVTNRDRWVYDWSETKLMENVRRIAETYNAEVDRWKREGCPSGIDNFVLADDTKIKWSRDLKSDLKRTRYISLTNKSIRRALYRPFTDKTYYFDSILSQDIFLWDRYLPIPSCEDENRIICVSATAASGPLCCLITNRLTDLHYVGDSQCFPFYTYKADGTDRKDNITDVILTQFCEKYGKEVSKWDVFYYIYALLHHPFYGVHYAKDLKRELPRIPLTVSPDDFPTYVEIGRKLADLHLNYETVKEYPLKWIENNEIPFSWRVEKMRLSKDKNTLIVNDSLTLTGFPPECYDYRLGNRSALEWVIDQYHISADKRSGITTDPNRPDDPEYIIRLVGRVVTVSVETVKLVNALPDLGIQT